ncbi:hypothetical protein SAMN06269250_4850 [Spirosoma fluviale]|uniref:Uncharacterized protein n=1 Tax=Spirosoma fluviale TaxID=1597977 RepID=A0A286GIP5_9BACT|nr:hypothetical protein SAMN06269250_4850 [Spirosoma fluviale]
MALNEKYLFFWSSFIVNLFMYLVKKPSHATPQPKRAYQSPKLKTLGNVKFLTLKTGSSVDGFGTFG